VVQGAGDIPGAGGAGGAGGAEGGQFSFFSFFSLCNKEKAAVRGEFHVR
jgi:hypothetical protein